jgi:neutral amino acid transport system ATP-binding protein
MDAETTTSYRDVARAALATCEPQPGSKKPDPILIADGVRRHFGGITAVDVDHIEVQRGSITALIGPNGAGKTTFFNLITGFDEPDGGDWSFEGTRVGGMAAHKVARLGMVRLPVDQEPDQDVGDREHASRRHRTDG